MTQEGERVYFLTPIMPSLKLLFYVRNMELRQCSWKVGNKERERER